MKKKALPSLLVLMLLIAPLAHAVEPMSPALGNVEFALLSNEAAEMTTLRALPDETAASVGAYYNGVPVGILGGAGAWVLVRVGETDEDTVSGYAPFDCIDMRVPSAGEETGIPIGTAPDGVQVSVWGETDGKLHVDAGGLRQFLPMDTELTGEHEPIPAERVDFLMSSRGFWQEAGYYAENMTMPGLYTFLVGHGALGRLTITGPAGAFEREFNVDGESAFTFEVAEQTAISFSGGWISPANGLPLLTAGQQSPNEIHSARIKIGFQEAPGPYTIRLPDGETTVHYAIYAEGYDRGESEDVVRVALEPGKESTTPFLEAGQYLELFNCVIWTDGVLSLR